jgi:hypothetical protein
MKRSRLLTMLALAAQPLPLLAQSPLAPERRLSPRRDFTGVYITNFEISYFIECDPTDGSCDDFRPGEARWLAGSSPEREARLWRCIARWNGTHYRWARFAISFQGRETLDRQPKRFLHDTERHVLLDDLVALELVGTEQTLEWTGPRYRRRPTLGC